MFPYQISIPDFLENTKSLLQNFGRITKIETPAKSQNRILTFKGDNFLLNSKSNVSKQYYTSLLLSKCK